MAKKVFTDESLAVFVDEIKAYINEVALNIQEQLNTITSNVNNKIDASELNSAIESALLEAKNNGDLFTDNDKESEN